MKIAILDPTMYAPGLHYIFNSDYYLIKYDSRFNSNIDTTPENFFDTYKFNYHEDLNYINSENYDILFLVYPIMNFNDKSRLREAYHLERIKYILSNNTFKKVVIFDNHDYNYDPIKEFPEIKADIWFKRNVSSEMIYSENVIPFPFIIFGMICPLWKVLFLNYKSEYKFDRVLWGGSKAGPNPTTPFYLARDYIIDKLGNFIYTVNVDNIRYLDEISKSKFCLDLNGNGDPNIRTFEVLCANSLLIQQHKNLVWPFDSGDAFSEETIFKTPEELIDKITALRADNELYNKCYNNQMYIKNKYFTADWLRSYILRYI